jgi:hypothetical protein
MLLYLLVVQPYSSWQLQWMEVVIHALEGGILVAAMFVMDGVQHVTVAWVMIGRCMVTLTSVCFALTAICTNTSS